MSNHALMLNTSFEPLHVVSWKRAVQLLFEGKVEVVEESNTSVRTISFSMKVPSVIRLLRYVPLRKKRRIVRFSRSNVFIRDNYHCQYCGRRFPKAHLTLDHVTPVVQGGKKAWKNIVTSCVKCNQKKGGRTPEEAGFRLIRVPREPRWLPRVDLNIGITVTPDSWKIYLYPSGADP